MAQLTQKQKQILAFIREYFAENSVSPTLEEIADNVDIESRAGVHYHVKVLENEGFITKDNSIGKRTLQLAESLKFTRIPLLGVANAGQPLANAEEERMGIIEVDSTVVKNNGNLFAVKVDGDSMNQQYAPSKKSPYATLLSDNSIAIIDKEAQINEGDIVLAIINGGATIKVYNKTENSIVLKPNSSNQKHQPIFIFENEDLLINGKVVLALNVPN